MTPRGHPPSEGGQRPAPLSHPTRVHKTISVWPRRCSPMARSRTYVSVPVSVASVAFTIRDLHTKSAVVDVTPHGLGQRFHVLAISQHAVLVASRTETSP